MPAALFVAALEQLARDLVPRELVELPVVAEEAAHQREENEGAGPSIRKNQIPKTTSAITALVPKIRASAPSRWSWPAARRTIRHSRSSREASESVTNSEARMPAKATTIPSMCEPSA